MGNAHDTPIIHNTSTKSLKMRNKAGIILKKKKYYFIIILFGLIVLSIIVLSESIVRISFLLSGRGGYIWIPDEYLGVAHAPNSKFVYESAFNHEFSITRKTNSLGLVGEQISTKKQGNTFRILILGDSFTEGLHVREGTNFCEQLQFLLNKNIFCKTKAFQVINAGVSGGSPISEFIFFKRELVKLSPDIVILQMFTNDIFEDNKAAAMSVLDNTGLPIKINKFFTNENKLNTQTFNQDSQLQELIYKIKKSIFNNSAFFQCVTRSQKKFLKKSPSNKKMNAMPEFNDDNQFFIIQDDNLLFKDKNFRDKALGRTEKYILAIRDLAIKNNAKFFIFLIPPEKQLSLEHYSEHTSYFRTRPSFYLNEELKEFSNNEQIEYLDLLPIFEKNKNKGLYYNMDGHIKENGHTIVAEALFDFICGKRGCVLKGQVKQE